MLSTECRFGIAYRCVSANRIEPCSNSLHRGPASGNRLAASSHGTRSRSTSAQPTGWNDRSSPAPLADGLLRGAPLVQRILFRGVPLRGVALGRRICGRSVRVFGARRVVFRPSGAHLRAVDAPSAVVSWTPRLHDVVTTTGFTAHRSSTGAFQPPASSDRCAPPVTVPHRFIA